VINHAGAAAVRLVADRTGLTGALSRALARRGFVPVHDRGRVLADTTVLIADGGRVLADLATLRDQAELYGPVASDSTLWRTLDELGDQQRRKIARARARTPTRRGRGCPAGRPRWITPRRETVRGKGSGGWGRRGRASHPPQVGAVRSTRYCRIVGGVAGVPDRPRIST
jgi:hypothetical protein